MIQLSRRRLIGGIGLLFAAPIIVRAESLMKVRALAPVSFSQGISDFCITKWIVRFECRNDGSVRLFDFNESANEWVERI